MWASRRAKSFQTTPFDCCIQPLFWTRHWSIFVLTFVIFTDLPSHEIFGGWGVCDLRKTLKIGGNCYLMWVTTIGLRASSIALSPVLFSWSWAESEQLTKWLSTKRVPNLNFDQSSVYFGEINVELQTYIIIYRSYCHVRCVWLFISYMNTQRRIFFEDLIQCKKRKSYSKMLLNKQTRKLRTKHSNIKICTLKAIFKMWLGFIPHWGFYCLITQSGLKGNLHSYNKLALNCLR